MANPLFNLLNGNQMQLPGQLGNMQNFMNQFNQFRSTFRGDPRQQIQQMMQNGQISQQQIDQLAPLATQIYNSISRR